ncbi:glycosyltransferase family 4 protein [Candidatus Nanohalobium constans]|uniref:Glycosyl transferase group 1 n=1 Tax=Candidatus Nanohalobium constans TaxID=2565781 RepID=A0A5Q0UEQ8_9ARCH|nr:glycosyltransferase family 4 protein [Candidatus Nanohalobium constans]QGA80027.1 glycosyl transferase group 1 [Candidatus Nanohalobium constans]
MRIAYLVKNFADGDDLSEYVKSLAEYMASQGHEPFVVSFDDGSKYTVSEEVEVERFQLHFDGDSLYTWAMMMNNEMKGKVVEKMKDEEIDVIHSNDWITAPGGVTLSNHLEKPFFLTIHSTENQRGFQGENSGLISELEWQGSFEADRVFANNDGVKNSLLFDLDLADEKVCVADPLHDGWQERILNCYCEIFDKEEEVEVEM